MSIETFADVLIEEQHRVAPVVHKCDLAKALGRMPDDMNVEVKKALGSLQWTAAAIARTLNRLGFPVTEGAIRRCRRTCDCWRVPEFDLTPEIDLVDVERGI